MPAQALARIRLIRRERRGAERDRRLLEGTLKYRGDFCSVELLDLSAQGAFVTGPALPGLSDSVTINIDLPLGGGTVMISGRVRRVAMGSRALERAGGFGVEFTRFYSQAGQSSLRRYLAA
ncbi:MAG: PilZ domain-containing protein [Deltaproteobacteria bacterium]|nr:PilZ domain-containing protein [Deltaproteobacteria bacterium]